MIVDDLNVPGVSVGPSAANSPLVIYPNAVLPVATALESFKAVAWRRTQLVKEFGGVKHEQLSPRDPLDCGETADQFVLEEALRIPALEAAYHSPKVSFDAYPVKQNTQTLSSRYSRSHGLITCMNVSNSVCLIAR